MYRIGILGSENSHALAFAQIFNGYKPEFEGEFPDIQVVAAFGRYPESNQELQDKCGVKQIAERPEDMLGQVDAIMVTARDGRYHAEYARPFLEAGLPAFIDKPFTMNGPEALALAQLAKAHHAPLVGGSSLKRCLETQRLRRFAEKNNGKILGGSVCAPVSMKNEYGDFYFYSSHLAEISLSVFGYNPQWVDASETAGGVGVLAHYDGYDVSNHFAEGMYQYAGTVITPAGIHTQTIDLDGAYAEECRSFARMLRSGHMDDPYEALVQPVFYLNAIEQAMRTGVRQPVVKAEL